MRKLVLDSIETAEGDRCVDIFRRGDGSFGFEVYRRDTEALTGWFPIGGFAERTFATEAACREAARPVAPWMDGNT